MHEPILDTSCNRSNARANDSGGDMGDFDMEDFAMSHVQFCGGGVVDRWI